MFVCVDGPENILHAFLYAWCVCFFFGGGGREGQPYPYCFSNLSLVLCLQYAQDSRIQALSGDFQRTCGKMHEQILLGV